MIILQKYERQLKRYSGEMLISINIVGFVVTFRNKIIGKVVSHCDNKVEILADCDEEFYVTSINDTCGLIEIVEVELIQIFPWNSEVGEGLKLFDHEHFITQIRETGCDSQN